MKEQAIGISTEIIEKIEKLIGLHRQLIEVLRRERQAITAMQMREVQDCLLLKQGIIDQIQQQENLRRDQTQKVFEICHPNAREHKLLPLADLIRPHSRELSERLMSLGNTLDHLVEKSMDQNSKNQTLVQNAMAHVQQMKTNLLGQENQTATNYDHSGQKARALSQARLISQEV